MLPARLLIYDRTCRGRAGLPGLSFAWWAGSILYRTRSCLDACYPAASWAEALEFLGTWQPGRTISEIQFWGHGKWGDARIGADTLDERSLLRTHPFNAKISAVRARLAPRALWWFRTCETFGAERGQHFARVWADHLGARVAGHTYVIGFWQSGLHPLEPGETPDWPEDEGLIEGTPRTPGRARASAPSEPNTITCLQNVFRGK